MQWSEFTSVVGMLTDNISSIFTIMDSVNVISEPAVSWLDFFLGMVIVYEAWELILQLKEDKYYDMWG